MNEWIAIYILLIVGSALQNTIGFGFGLLCAPILIYVAPEMVPVPMILNALFLTSLIAFKNYKHINTRQITFSAAGGTIGVACASVLLAVLDSEIYRMLFGGLVLISVLLSLVGYTPSIKASTSVIAGTLAGFMGTLTSAGGAPMGILYQNADRKSIKANLNTFFIYINAAGVVGLALAGYVTQRHFVLFLLSIPAILVGWLLIDFLQDKINESLVKPLILLTASIAGITLLIK